MADFLGGRGSFSGDSGRWIFFPSNLGWMDVLSGSFGAMRRKMHDKRMVKAFISTYK